MDSSTPNKEHQQRDLADCKAVVTSILRAMRTHTLYPEDHAHCQGAVQKLQSDLNAYFSNHEDLVFLVEKNRLLYGEEVVHKTSAQKGDLAFALFRDGIFKFSFRRGIDSGEIKELLKILSKYQTLPPEPEGDIVTALWEAQLPHFYYDAIDHIWESDSDSHDSLSEKRRGVREQLLSAQAPTSSTGPVENDQGAHLIEGSENEAEDLPSVDLNAMQLTTEEIEKIQDIVRREEKRDATLDILNMLTDILNEEKDEAFLDIILEYMEEELQGAFARKHIEVSFRILRRLHQIILTFKDSNPSNLARVRDFFIKVSKPDFLAILKDVLPTMSTSELQALEKVLLLLPPTALGALCALMQEISAPPVRKFLSGVIISFASRRFEAFENVLDTADEDLLPYLVPLLGRMAAEKTGPILIKMARHQSKKIRKEALKAIMANGLWLPEELLFLMDDKSTAVRQLFMRYLRSHRSEALEGLLLDYVKNLNPRGKNGDHLIDCFEILGRCGTGLSIPYLEDNLMNGGWISKFCHSVRRQGAAIALKELGTEKAVKVLEQASQSHFPGIRGAAQEVMQGSRH